jgi:hypothetical protein
MDLVQELFLGRSRWCPERLVEVRRGASIRAGSWHGRQHIVIGRIKGEPE